MLQNNRSALQQFPDEHIGVPLSLNSSASGSSSHAPQQNPLPSQISQASNRSLVYHASQQDRSKYIMVADIASAKIFANIMQCINPSDIKKKREQAWAICEIVEEGIKFYIQDRTFQGVAAMKSGIFQNYLFSAPKDTKYQFEINVSVLIDCLILYGANASQGTIVKLCYPGVDNTLSLLLGEERVVTDCNIKIRKCELDPIDFKFKEHPIGTKIILKSEILTDALAEIDWLSKTLEIGVELEEQAEGNQEDTLQRGKLFFKTSDNVIGSLEVSVKSTSEGVQAFECQATQVGLYKLSHIQQAMKALNHAEKVCIRMNNQGTLSMQFAIRATEPVTYVEYLMLPVDAEVEMEEDDNSSFQ
ncbi:hypothetical protein C9374_002217 [Naegleria lovaniensis]|uniref:Uncharacterized protein n=1 Tax=Naegleria lovaniensis TaxID=51637 RepID=A0AA88GUZ2_NAELO|nr:uncharacterized protein C9374_002217 [Naegleria lovaniensis]KAG2386473.1 hypothetical protein C9374_002217 [Naegleria lovaniensis]